MTDGCWLKALSRSFELVTVVPISRRFLCE
jgi:hypothetical protein